MRILQISLVVALVLAMLPWGAYLTPRSLPGSAEAAQIEDRHTASAMSFKPGKRCRTTLPGGPCHQDAGVMPAEMTASDAGAMSAIGADEPGLPPGTAPSAIFHPPRDR